MSKVVFEAAPPLETILIEGIFTNERIQFAGKTYTKVKYDNTSKRYFWLEGSSFATGKQDYGILKSPNTGNDRNVGVLFRTNVPTTATYLRDIDTSRSYPIIDLINNIYKDKDDTLSSTDSYKG